MLVLHGDEKEPVLNGRVTVCVDTTVDAVLADGKLTIRYDSQKLQFLSAKGGEARELGISEEQAEEPSGQ